MICTYRTAFMRQLGVFLL